MELHTALYAAHLAANAHMVEFAGWSMPLHYGSQLNEHLQVRQDVGMFDVSHMGIIDLSGAQSNAFLSKLLANDINKLTVGRALYSCMLDLAGGVIDDLIVYFMAPDSYRLVVNAACKDKDLAWISEQAQQFAVKVVLRTDLSIVAIQGPNARSKFAQVVPQEVGFASNNLARFACAQVEGYFIARTGYTGEDGFEVITTQSKIVELWDKLLEIGVQPIGLGARDTLRLEAGLNLYGNDMDLNTSPLETNLAWTVAFEPMGREFNGRESLQIQKRTGINKQLVGVVMPNRGVLRHGQKIYQAQREVGVITSGGFAPSLRTSIGFALLSTPIGADYVVDIRGKMHTLNVVKVPFIKNGQMNF